MVKGIFLSVMIILGGGLAFFWYFSPRYFPVSTVKLIGERKYLSETALRQVIIPELKSGFFRLKVSTVQQQLLLLPWIKQVNVRKVWPNILVVHFEEHIPAARWGKNGVISKEGILFYPSLSQITLPPLPILQGPRPLVSVVWEQFLKMQAMLAPLDLTISQVVLAPRGAWQIALSNKISVILGTQDILERLERFTRLYVKQQQETGQNIVAVDLRYTNGMAVSYKTHPSSA